MDNINQTNLKYVNFFNQICSETNKSELEFEIIFGSKKDIDNSQFVNLLNMLKNPLDFSHILSSDLHPIRFEKTTSLDISLYKSDNINIGRNNQFNLRISLTGSNISKYCKTGEIKGMGYEITFKKPHTTNKVSRLIDQQLTKFTENSPLLLDLNDDDVRITLKDEISTTENGNFKTANSDLRRQAVRELRHYTEFLENMGNNFENIYKTFRLKNRYSFFIGEHRLDMTVVRSSSKQLNSRGQYVQKPVRQFIDSNVVTNDKEYEIELELYADKFSTVQHDDRFAEELMQKIVNINACIQNYPIYTPVSIQNSVLEVYKSFLRNDLSRRIMTKLDKIEELNNYYELLENDPTQAENLYDSYPKYSFKKDFIDSGEDPEKMSDKLRESLEKLNRNMFPYSSDRFYFHSPKPTGMELKNVQNNDESITSILYTVTDKADGQGMLCYIVGLDHLEDSQKEKYSNLEGQMFLIDSNMKVYATGYLCNNEALHNSLFNGEYLDSDRNEKYLHAYMIYDLYIVGGRNIQNLPLMSKNSNKETRLSICTHVLENLNIIAHTGFELSNRQLSDLNNLEILSIKLKDFKIGEGVDIFKQSGIVWNNYTNYRSVYKFDGLIFTPADMPVSYNSRNTLTYDHVINSSWLTNLKWKPEYENTIDFLIEEEQDLVSSFGDKTIYKPKIRTNIVNKNAIKTFEKYKTFNLKLGKYESEYENYCIRQLKKPRNKKLNRKPKYLATEFIPTMPYDKDVHIAKLKLSESKNDVFGHIWNIDNPLGQEWEETNDLIKNDTIVEFSYQHYPKDDPRYISDKHFRWIPLRTRHDKTYTYKKGVEQQKSKFNLLNKLLSIAQSGKDLSGSNRALLNKIKNVILAVPGILNRFKNYEYDLFDVVKENVERIQNYYPSYKHIKAGISITYGNDFKTANSIWTSIHNPVTVEMITTGENIPQYTVESNKYYRRDVSIKRDKSLTIQLQNFHNLEIKNRILYGSISKYLRENGNESISLLDLATGKGGDIPKWKQHRIENIVGIDIVKNNIYDKIDGACVRANNYSLQAEKRGNFMPNINFLVGDVGKSIETGESFRNDNVSFQLWEKLWKTSMQTEGYDRKKFDVVSIMFAIHYLFKNETMLDNLIDNIDKNLKMGGFLIGACFDGQSVFDLLSNKKFNSYETGSKNGNIIWKLRKKYRQDNFQANSTSLGMGVDVWIGSINQEITEYLVNFDYLVEKLREKNIELVTSELAHEMGLPNNKGSASFSEVYSDIQQKFQGMESNSKDYKRLNDIFSNISEDEKRLSFLSRYFIFRKITQEDEQLMEVYNYVRLNYETDSNLSKILRKRSKDYNKLQTEIESKLGKVISSDIWEQCKLKIAAAFESGELKYKRKVKKIVRKAASIVSEPSASVDSSDTASSKTSSSTKSSVKKGIKIRRKIVTKGKKLSTKSKVQNKRLEDDFNRFYKLTKSFLEKYDSEDNRLSKTNDIDGKYTKLVHPTDGILNKIIKKYKNLYAKTLDSNIKGKYEEIQQILQEMMARE